MSHCTHYKSAKSQQQTYKYTYILFPPITATKRTFKTDRRDPQIGNRKRKKSAIILSCKKPSPMFTVPTPLCTCICVKGVTFCSCIN